MWTVHNPVPTGVSNALCINVEPPEPAQSHRPIGEAIIDQRVVAGMGTVYRAEVLFIRGVNPWTPLDAVREPEQLLELARRLLMANRSRPERITTGDARRGRQLWVYGRGGDPCRRCGIRIQWDGMGRAGQERVIYWCPTCQPESATRRT